MSTNGIPTATTATTGPSSASTLLAHPVATDSVEVTSTPEQLTLLGTTDVPLQFRIDERTRRCGLAHIAALRAQLVAQAAQRNLSAEGKRPLTRNASRQIAA